MEEDRVLSSGTQNRYILILPIQAIKIPFQCTLIVSNVYGKVIFHFQKKKKISSRFDNPSEKYQGNDIMFRSGKYNLKIRSGMHVPLLTYFSSERLSDFLDNRERGRKRRGKGQREGGSEGEKDRGRKRVSERKRKRREERDSGREVRLHHCTMA